MERHLFSDRSCPWPYYYGKQGRGFNSHMQANIREYEKELAEDSEVADLHRKIVEMYKDGQF